MLPANSAMNRVLTVIIVRWSHLGVPTSVTMLLRVAMTTAFGIHGTLYMTGMWSSEPASSGSSSSVQGMAKDFGRP